MALLFSIDLVGAPEFARIFQKVPRTLSSLRPEMQKIGRIIQDRFATVFRQEGAVGGLPEWRPLSRTWTVLERLRLGYGGEHPILVRTGRYRRSFRPLQVTDFSVSVGSDDIRDELLQRGGVNALKRIVPARGITARVAKTFRARDWVEVTTVLRRGLKAIWESEKIPMGGMA